MVFQTQYFQQFAFQKPNFDKYHSQMTSTFNWDELGEKVPFKGDTKARTTQILCHELF